MLGWVHLHNFLPLLQGKETVMTSILTSHAAGNFLAGLLWLRAYTLTGKILSLAVGPGLDRPTEIGMTGSTRLATDKNNNNNNTYKNKIIIKNEKKKTKKKKKKHGCPF